MQDDNLPSPSMRKRQRPNDLHTPEGAAPALDDGFIADADAQESGGDDDEDEGVGKPADKKAGRRKIKIEFIQDKSRRHITFSKRKAGIMKKAYELSTLTGTQVLLLVVSETGLVYTFTTAKLQPLVTQPEGKNLIQACLNAPQGTLPSSMPVGQPLGRPSGPQPTPIPPPPASHAPPMHPPNAPRNVPGGLAIGGGGPGKEDDGDAGGDGGDDKERSDTGRPRRGSKAPAPQQNTSNPTRSPTSPHTPHMVPGPGGSPPMMAGQPPGGAPYGNDQSQSVQHGMYQPQLGAPGGGPGMGNVHHAPHTPMMYYPPGTAPGGQWGQPPQAAAGAPAQAGPYRR